MRGRTAGRAGLLAVLMLGALTACGGGGTPGSSSIATTSSSESLPASSAPPPGGTPTSQPTPPGTPQSGTVALPATPGTSAVKVLVGTRLTVNLAPAQDYSWTAPTSSGAAVVRVDSSTAPRDGSASARFVAVAAGTAVLQATFQPAPCSPVPCGRPAALWQVTVTVVA